MQPKVSVIVPVYNAERFLRQCLDSICAQPLREIEIICVDDGSTDASLSILREYEARDDRFRVLTQRNRFAGAARNRGMELAQGEYLAFMDADDYFVEDALSTLRETADAASLDVVKGAFFHIEPDKEPYDTAYSVNARLSPAAMGRVLSSEKDYRELLEIADVPWNGLYRTEFIRRNGIAFNGLRCVNDRSFFIECMSRAERAMVIDRHVAYHRTNQNASLVGKRGEYFSCQLDSYGIVKEAVRGLPNARRRFILRRELENALWWYRELRNPADPLMNAQMDRQMRQFIKSFDARDVGIASLLAMDNRKLYFKMKLGLSKMP